MVLMDNNHMTQLTDPTPSTLSPDSALLTSSSSDSCPSPKPDRCHSPSNSVSSCVSSKSAIYQNSNDTTLTASKQPNNNKAGSERTVDENDDPANTSCDDYSDEIKVYNEEGAAEEEQRNCDDLKEEKTEIIKQTIEEKPSSNHPFSINNLFNFSAGSSGSKSAQAAASPFSVANPFAAAAAFGAFQQQRQASLFNPAALYSQELANHFASWWPAAAAGASFNPYSTQSFNPFNAFNAAAANYQQQAAAAAVFQAAASASRFSPSLFLPPPPTGLASPKSEPSAHSASSSASSTTSNSSSSSAFSGASHQNNFNNSNSSTPSRFNNNNPGHLSSPHNQHKHSAKKKPAYDGYSNPHNNHHNQHQSMPVGQHHSMSHSFNPNHHNNRAPNSNPNNPYQAGPPNTMSAPIPHVLVKEKPKKPHVKKPLNAFMLFMKEQRAAVVSECTLRESAAINQILGRKWHELERTEQAKYYEKARLARLEHMQQNPGWSARDNYGLKKKRRRKREKVIGENGELPRKCRARYGLHQLHLWCKPCRRKKKCIRFAMEVNGEMNGQGVQQQFGEGGSGGSMNGGNSEDDYDGYEDDSDEETDEEMSGDDEMHGDEGPPSSKLPHLMLPHLPHQQQQQQHGLGVPGHYQQHLQGQMYPGQHQQHMQNSMAFNNQLLKCMSGQMNESKAMLHHQLRLNQEPI